MRVVFIYLFITCNILLDVYNKIIYRSYEFFYFTISFPPIDKIWIGEINCHHLQAIFNTCSAGSVIYMHKQYSHMVHVYLKTTTVM